MSVYYRKRIYDSYVTSRTSRLSPDTLAGLKPRQPYLTKLIREHFPSDKASSILDLACGYGALVHYANCAGYHNIVGVDISQEQVDAARDLGIKGITQGDLMDTLCAITTSTKDVVVTFDVIEHFTKDELLPFVDEVKRVLKPGGIWIIHTPNGESPFVTRIFFGDYTHEQAFTRTSINQLLLSSGFGKVECFEDAPIAHGAKSFIRRLLWKGLRGVLKLFIACETGDLSRDLVLSQNFLIVAHNTP